LYAPHGKQCPGHHEAQSHGIGQQSRNPPCATRRQSITDLLYIQETLSLNSDLEAKYPGHKHQKV
jgi:hypothetical protein